MTQEGDDVGLAEVAGVSEVAVGIAVEAAVAAGPSGIPSGVACSVR